MARRGAKSSIARVWSFRRSKFEPLRLLGVGGMGEVFLARTSSGEQVALKRPHRHLARTREWMRLFDAESHICSLLHHEHIVAVRESGADRDGPYLALEYVDGFTLRQVLVASKLTARPLPLEAVRVLARHLAEGLRYAHALKTAGREGVVHRDVSPENVLVSREGCAKLSDFGVAKLLSSTLSTTGNLRGKLGYLAPELYEGAAASVRSDLFSAAATLYEALVQARPFEGRTEGELMRATLFSTPVRVDALRPDVPAGLAGWIEQALSRDAAARPPDAATLLEAIDGSGGETGRNPSALAQAVRQLGEAGAFASLHHESTLRGPAARPTARPRAWQGVLALLVLGGAGGAVTLWPRAPAVVPPPPSAPAPLPSETQARAAPIPVTQPPARTVAPKPVKQKAPATEAPASLWIRASPWAEVIVDGEYRGMTPLPAFRLPAGPHTVLLVNKELKAHRSINLKLKPGEERVLREDLAKPQ